MTQPFEPVYPKRIETLTVFRFFAAMAVFLYHVPHYVPFTNKLCSDIAAKGYLGVDFFFLLSGFILTHAYLPARDTGRFSVKTFFGHRLGRIYPMHALTLFFATLLGVGKVEGWTLSTTKLDFFANLFLVNAWGNARSFSFNGPAWSISAEWFAYLLFPILLAHFTRLRTARMIFVTAWIYGGITMISHQFFHKDVTDFSAYFGIIRVFPEFLLGMTVYVLGMRYPSRRHTIFLLNTSLILLLGALVKGFPGFMVVALMSMIIYFAAMASDGRKNRFMMTPLIYFGEISYSFYMLHIFVLFGMWKIGLAEGHRGLLIGLAFPLTVALASISYHTWEKPMRRRVRQWLEPGTELVPEFPIL